jgi:hypothetical protein
MADKKDEKDEGVAAAISDPSVDTSQLNDDGTHKSAEEGPPIGKPSK